MNFFKVMMSPDQEELENAERSMVADAANLLEIGEFQFLQLAYHEWHGDDLPEALIDKLFADYMLRSEVPNWARHYARKILELEEKGLLDGNAPAYHRYDHAYGTGVPRGLRQFVVVTTLLVGVVGGSLAFANYSTTETLNVRSVLPPYFTEKELRGAASTRESLWGRSDMIDGRSEENPATQGRGGNDVVPADLLPKFGVRD